MLGFYSADAANYYWIGGTGNWSDTTHWATTSGGTTHHSLVPTPNDNVIFDSLSFTGAGQSVTLNTGNFLCRSMDWTEAQFNPAFIGSLSDTLEVYGSLTFATSMSNNFLGDYGGGIILNHICFLFRDRKKICII